MLLSVTLGALLYILIQFLWYSPIGFGREWLSLKRETPETVIALLKEPDTFPKSVLHIVAPAFLMSAALHALAVVLTPLGRQSFFLGVGFMLLATALPKHFTRRENHEREQPLLWIGDGALAVSLFSLALFVTWAEHTLY